MSTILDNRDKSETTFKEASATKTRLESAVQVLKQQIKQTSNPATKASLQIQLGVQTEKLKIATTAYKNAERESATAWKQATQVKNQCSLGISSACFDDNPDDARNPDHYADSIYKSGRLPEGWQPHKNGEQKPKANNTGLIIELRKLYPGKWVKVFKKGYIIRDGQRIDVNIHFFQHQSGKVFNVKIK